MGLEQWGASEQCYKIVSGYPEYELGRVISQEKDLFRVVMDKEECLEIINLLKKGVDINKIYLTNVSTDYLYTIKSLFSFYHIPININYLYIMLQLLSPGISFPLEM